MKKINHIDSIRHPNITEKATIYLNKIKQFLRFMKKQTRKQLRKI